MKNKILSKVFGWMFLGLMITFCTGYIVSNSQTMLENVFTGPMYWIIIIAEIGLAFYLSARVYKMNGTTATCLYLFYTFLTGLTFASIFVVFEMSSIIFIFFIAALLFGTFSLIGRFTKLDLSKIGTYLFMGLIGIVVISIVNTFLLNNTLNMVAAIIGLVVFLGYTAYDIQRIVKNDYTGIDDRNTAIISAFTLYLDFINIFIDLLSLFGNSKD